MKLFAALLVFAFSPCADASECPEVGPLTETRVVKEFGLSFMYPKGFFPVGMTTSVAYISLVSRPYYESGKAARTVRVQFEIRKTNQYDRTALDRILKSRESNSMYKEVGSLTVGGEELPIHQVQSKRTKKKSYSAFIPSREGKYVELKTSQNTKDFSESCEEKLNELALALARSVRR